MISLIFPNKSNSNARKAENRYFFLMKERSRISNNHAENKKKIIQKYCEWIKGERKLKLLFETDKETKNQAFLPSTEKISMQKETRIPPNKERLKTTWITHAFQVQNKPKHTQENEMYISQF